MIALGLDKPFGHAGLKMQWAVRHLSELYRLIPNYLGTISHDIHFIKEGEYGKIGVTLTAPLILPEIPLHICDAAHCLRATLDYMINEIDRRLNPSRAVNERLYFPFAKCKKAYEGSVRKLVNCNNITQDIADVITTSIRPWALPSGTGNEIFWGLSQLDNIEKHRLLVPTAMAAAVHGLAFDTIGTVAGSTRDMSIVLRPIENGRGHFVGVTNVMGIGSSNLEFKLVDKGCVDLHLVFADDVYIGRGVLPVLEQLSGLTIDAFNALYARMFGVEPRLCLIPK